MTHFGMTMLRQNPQKTAENLSEAYKTEVIAAYDGLRLEF